MLEGGHVNVYKCHALCKGFNGQVMTSDKTEDKNKFGGHSINQSINQSICQSNQFVKRGVCCHAKEDMWGLTMPPCLT
ncbi:unnamed protein product [Discosporangium mesarthrocarpum]